MEINSNNNIKHLEKVIFFDDTTKTENYYTTDPKIAHDLLLLGHQVRAVEVGSHWGTSYIKDMDIKNHVFKTQSGSVYTFS